MPMGTYFEINGNTARGAILSPRNDDLGANANVILANVRRILAGLRRLAAMTS
jgi:hypothetical protein